MSYLFSCQNLRSLKSVGSFILLVMFGLLANSPKATATTYYSANGVSNAIWTNATSWTLSPTGGGFPGFSIPVNGPGSAVNGTSLSNTDTAVILSGSVVYLSATARQIQVIEIQQGATLVLGQQDNTPITTYEIGQILGQGTLVVLSVTGVPAIYNLPTAIAPAATDLTEFTASSGGTIRLAESTGRIPNRTYNNLELSSTTAQTFTVASDLTLNGSLQLTLAADLVVGFSGTPHDVSIAENVETSASHTGDVSFHNTSGDVLHTIELQGDFLHRGTGTIDWTDDTQLVPEETAYDGVSLVFSNPTADQTLRIFAGAGQADFHQIAIEKGVDETYTLNLEADTESQFNLFGPGLGGDNADAVGIRRNDYALALRAGTVRIGPGINVTLKGDANINDNRNYDIPAEARMLVAGGTVNLCDTNDTPAPQAGLAPYGTFEVQSGTANLIGGNRAIVIRREGQVVISGGVVNTNGLRVALFGTANRPSYRQSGGVFNLVNTGSFGPSTDYAGFDLGFPECVFTMTGGVLNITKDGAGNGNNVGFRIDSDIENIDVSGGSINFILNGDFDSPNLDFEYTGTSSYFPFWNLGIYRTANANANQNVDFAVGTEIRVQNDFILSDTLSSTNPVFFQNDRHVSVGRNLFIDANTSYSIGTDALLEFNGDLSGVITVNGEFRNAAGTAATNLQRFKVAKLNGQRILQNTSLVVEDSLIVESGILEYGNETMTVLGVAQVFDRVSDLPTFTGRFILAGTSAQELIVGSGVDEIRHLEIDNPNHVTLVGGDLDTLDNLTLTNGRFILGTNGIRLLNEPTSASAFGTTRMITTAGNASDDAVDFYINGNGTYSLPMGVETGLKYTPIDLTISSFSDDGFLQISAADSPTEVLPKLENNINNGGETGGALTYYWQVISSGFATPPNVAYNFQATASDIPATFNNTTLWRSGRVEFNVRTVEPIAYDNVGNLVSIGAHAIPNRAEYTAAYFNGGSDSKWNGTVRVFYSRDPNGNQSNFNTDGTPGGNDGLAWNNPNHWTFDGTLNPNFTPAAAGAVPGAGDIVVIRGENQGGNHYHTMYIPNDFAAEAAEVVIWNINGVFGPWLWVSETAGTGDQPIDLGYVRSTGDPGPVNLYFELDGSSRAFSGDFGEFVGEADNTWGYVPVANVVNVPATQTEFPILRIDGVTNAARDVIFPNVDFQINNDLWIQKNFDVFLSGGTEGDLIIEDDLRLGWNGNNPTARLIFPSSGSRTVTVKDRLRLFGSGNNMGIQVDNSTQTGAMHILSVGGNIDQERGFLDLYGGANPNANHVVLELSGIGDNAYTRTNGNVPELYQLRVNMPDDTSTFTFNQSFELLGPTDGTTKALDLQTGTLILNPSTAINLTLSSGGDDFRIPSSSALVLEDNVTAVVENSLTTNTADEQSGIFLGGTLEVANGSTLTLTGYDNGGTERVANLQYQATGVPTIRLRDGAFMEIDGAIRRQLLIAEGGLNLFLEDANTRLDVGTQANTAHVSMAQNRGVLEVLNQGNSTFILNGDGASGGSQPQIRVVEPRDGGTFPDVVIDAQNEDASFESGRVYIGNSTGARGTTFDILIGNVLNDLWIGNTGMTANPGVTVNLVSKPLIVTQRFSLYGGNSVFEPQGLDLYIGGNYLNQGTYNGNLSEHTLHWTGSANQIYTQDGIADNFYSWAVYNPSTFSINSDVELLDSLQIFQGTFRLNDTVLVRGNILNDGNIFDFDNVVGQNGQLIQNNNVSSLPPTIQGSGNFGLLEIATPSGATLESDITADSIILSGGVFDIGNFRLTFNTDGGIAGGNSIRYVNMSGALSERGVRVTYGANDPMNKVLPLGANGKYAPAEIVGTTAAGGGGSIDYRVRDLKSSSHTGFGSGVDDALNFHWDIVNNGVTPAAGFRQELQFNNNDLESTPPTGYEAGFIRPTDLSWTRGDNGANGCDFSADSTLNGGSSATTGVLTFEVLENAVYAAGLPAELDAIVTFYSNGNGNYSPASTWAEDPAGAIPAASGPDPNPGAPGGAARVIIQAGDTVALDLAGLKANGVEIQAGGALNVLQNGAVLGSVTGTGLMIINYDGSGNAPLPDADLSAFVGPTGGSFEFAGTGTYSIPSSLNEVNNLIFSGTGSRSLQTNTSVFGDLTWNGPEVDLNSRNLTLLGDANRLSGPFVATNGTVQFTASGDQTLNVVGADSFQVHNLTLNKASGDLRVSGDGNLVINNTVSFTDGRIIPTGTGQVVFSINAPQPTGNANSHIAGTACVDVPVSGRTFTFPVGNENVSFVNYRELGMVVDASSTRRRWCATFENDFLGGPIAGDSTMIGALTAVGTAHEYWILEDFPTGGQADVILSWGAGSYLPTLPNPDYTQYTVAVYNGSDWEAVLSDAPIGNNAAGSVRSTNAINFSSQILAVGSNQTIPLPVQLVEFTGEWREQNAALRWTTASEENSLWFVLERSLNGTEFEEVGMIAAAGFSNELLAYSYTDTDVPASAQQVYYRLKQQDFDLTTTYSQVIVLQREGAAPNEALVKVYPNPTYGYDLQVAVLDAQRLTPSTELRIVLRSANGVTYGQFKGTLAEILPLVQARVMELPEGYFLFELSALGERYSTRLVKQ